VLLADGLWLAFKGRTSVLYTMALKPISSHQAFLLDPTVAPGSEQGRRWVAVINALPDVVLRSIKALVSDGFRGSQRIAVSHGWVHQRCNFHLIAALQVRLGRQKRAIGGHLARESLYGCIRAALVAQDAAELAALCSMIRYWAEQPECPRRLRPIAREFLHHRDAFRAYLLHPTLRLPRTVGAIDSLHRSFRRVVYGVHNPGAALQRVTAFIRLHPIITCNGYDFPQK
jgi:hypothetical protein